MFKVLNRVVKMKKLPDKKGCHLINFFLLNRQPSISSPLKSHIATHNQQAYFFAI